MPQRSKTWKGSRTIGWPASGPLVCLSIATKSRLAKPSSMPSSTLGKLMLGPQVKR